MQTMWQDWLPCFSAVAGDDTYVNKAVIQIDGNTVIQIDGSSHFYGMHQRTKAQLMMDIECCRRASLLGRSGCSECGTTEMVTCHSHDNSC
jgi:hypothetical protein